MNSADKTIPGGLVVIFEGIDGVGKTTQLESAAEVLLSDGWLVHTTRGHGGTPIGEALRQVSLSPIERPVETDLYLSVAIHEALSKQLQVWRQGGAISLVDRGPLSMAAYQVYGDGFDARRGQLEVEADVKRFNAELIITYTASVAVALERAKRKAGHKHDYFENKPPGYFEAVSRGFKESSKRFQAVSIDAERPIPEVHKDTLQAIRAAIEKQQSNGS